MVASTVAPPESIVNMLSKRRGRDVAKGVGMLINWAEVDRDRALVQRSVRFTSDIISALKKAMPNLNPELIGNAVAALTDLWETGQTFDKEMKKLTKLRLPQDRQQLRDTLIWINAIQVDMASYWIQEVRRNMPKLLKALDQQERSGRRRTRARPPQNALKA
jgi:hypothetical protein